MIGLALLMTGCVEPYPITPCNSTAQCADAFGQGFICVDDGYCDVATPTPRCQNTKPADLFENWEDHTDTLLLGSLFDFGSDQANIVAVDMAIDEINNMGGINGRSVAMIHCNYEDNQDGDGLVDGEAVVYGAKRLFTDIGVAAAIGPAGSNDALYAYPYAAQAKSVLISPSATSPELKNIDAARAKTDDEPGLFWRTVGSDKIQAKILAEVAMSNNENSIALIYQSGSYGSNFIAKLSEALPLSIDRQSFTYQKTEDIETLIGDQAVFNERTGVVFISSDIDDIGDFVNGIAGRRDYQSLNIYLADAAADARLLSAEVADLKDEDIYGTRPALPKGNEFTLFADAYASTGYDAQENVYAAYTYDATWLALFGASWKSPNTEMKQGESLAQGLRMISDTTAESVQIGLGAVQGIALLNSSQTINAKGVSGELDFDQTTEELQNPIEIFRIGQNASGERCFSVVNTCEVDESNTVFCTPPEESSSCLVVEN